nr:hypothetical protein [uncultured Roseococcus sp.]
METRRRFHPSFILWQRELLGMGDHVTMRTIAVLIVAAMHATYFLVVVGKEGVEEGHGGMGGSLSFPPRP